VISKLFILAFFIFGGHFSYSETTCSSAEECQTLIDEANQRIEAINEQSRIESILEASQLEIDRLVVPEMHFARDRHGNVIEMTYDEAAKYCESLGFKLPTVLEFLLVSRLSGATIELVDVWDEAALNTVKGRTIEGSNLKSSHATNYRPRGFELGKQTSERTIIGYSYLGVQEWNHLDTFGDNHFWSRTVHYPGNQKVYVYRSIDASVGTSQAPIWYQRQRDGRMRYFYQKNAVVCAKPQS